MAELIVPPRNRREIEETAVAVRGALVPRQRGAGDLFANQNHQQATRKSTPRTDQEIMDFLEASGKVSVRELCSYITPAVINNQAGRTGSIINAIIDIINDMAKTRRLLLFYKLTKTGSPTEVEKLQKKLVRWPAQVQEMHGEIEGLNGRCLRIPHDLVRDLVLLD